MLFKGVAEEDGEVVAPLSLVFVVLLRFDRRCARDSARGVSAVRWIRVSLLGAPKLAGTDGLDVRKGEVLAVVQIVEDLVVRGAKGTVVGGFDGSQNDGPKYVVNDERAHLIKGSADIADFTEVGVDSVLGVAIPGHKASDLTGKRDSLHALVLEGEGSESLPYLLRAQKLVRAVLVKIGVGVGELGHRDARRRYTVSSRRSRSCSCLDPRRSEAQEPAARTARSRLQFALHAQRDPLRDEIREVGRGFSLADTQTGCYRRFYSRRRLCARRGTDARLILRILLELVLGDFGQNAILLITKSVIPIQVPGQYRLSPVTVSRVNAYSGGVLARALTEGLRYLST
jgi:hypothetical protein